MAESNYRQFLAVFIAEAEENLEALEQGLLELEARPNDAAVHNAVFRAAHTIKGSAGLVGQKAIQDFTHHLEDLLDRVRSGEIPADASLISLVLACVDCIRRMTANADAGREATEGIDLTETESKLRNYLPNAQGKEDGGSEEPRDDEPKASRRRHYHLRVVLGREVPTSGIDPLMFLEDIQGQAKILAFETDASALPAWDALNPVGWHLGWTMLLESPHGPEKIQDIFLFVADESRIELTELTDTFRDQEPEALETWRVDGKRLDELAQPERRRRTDRRAGLERRAPATDRRDGIDRRTGERAVGAPLEGTEAGRSDSLAEKSIRVDTEKLDKLLNMVSELVIAQSQISQFARELAGPHGDRLRDITAGIDKLSRQLQEHTMQLRMVHLGPVFYPFRRLVRDQALATGKQVRLLIEGEETELDKSLIAKISDPLKHMVRNAIDHGLETPEVREKSGKNPQGTLTLRAYTQGRNVVIEVADDGAGIRKARVLAKAQERGLIPPGVTPTDDEIHRLIFHPGLSTADKVTDLSGRGVGMDVVLSNVRDLSGEVEIDSVEERGTTFRIRLPLTLAILDGMVVEVGNEHFILPITSIEQTLRPEAGAIATAQGKGELLRLRDTWIPFVRMSNVFAVKGRTEDPTKALVVVLRQDRRRMALMIDRLVDQTQVVLKSLTGSIRAIEGVSGATIMGDGRVVLVLDPVGLMRHIFAGETRDAQHVPT